MAEDDFTGLPGSIAIVGVGLMGGSLGLALRGLPNAPRIVGIGRSPERLQRAVDVGAVDSVSTDLDAVGDVDAVFLCTTIQHIVDNIGPVLKRASRRATVTDVGSTKGAIVRRAGGHPNFVGGHPMAGSERAGVDSAVAGLYRGATWALTPTSDTDPRHVARARAVAEAAGATVLILEPDVHDAIVAITSHVPHVVAAALMQEAGRVRGEHAEAGSMTAGSFADTTRIAASPPEIWRDVCLTNRDAVLKALGNVADRLRVLAEAVEAEDPAAVEAFFAAGRDAKADWPAR